MSLRSLCAFAALAALLLGCSTAPETASPELPEPPVAAKNPQTFEIHGHERTDNYYWLRERENPEVIAHLEAENTYSTAALAHTEALQETLYEEIVGRIKQDDSSVPYKLDDYYYYTRMVEGGEYPIYCRKKGSLDAEEEVMVDANALAEGHEFFNVRGMQVSAEQNIAAFGVDTVGRRFYTIRFKNLDTGEMLPDTIPDVTGNLAWANDNKTLFYSKQDPETLRSHRIYRHELGTDPADDVLVYEEADDTFNSFVFRTRSKRYIMVASSQTLSTEFRYLDADQPTGELQVFLPRERDHEYSVDHFGDHFYIRTNWDAKNFRLMKTPVDNTSRDSWTEVIPHRDDTYFSSFTPFKDHLVVGERHAGLINMRIIPWDGSEEHSIDFGESAYLAYAQANPDFDTTVLRYGYTSMTTPNSIYDYDMVTREKTLLKRQEVVGGFEPSDYVTERLAVPARDGKEVPVSIVYKKGFEKNGQQPLLLYGYGSYGASLDPTFSASRLSLLDRGFAYAIAHIRGGQVMGREWYEDGKLFNKKNTFTDFIDVGQYLVDQQYTSSERLFAMGGSAGGLLMGAVVNMAPDLFEGIVAHVPFVDVINTMLDPDIPLTTGEYDEWGDPNQQDYYEYIMSYSPYDNVEAKDYPHILVTTGLHDSQVQYWEPAKWVAKLRELKTDDNRILLVTNMEAGHGGASGRFKRHRETAQYYAFLLDLAGIES